MEDKLSQMSYKEPKWLLVIMTLLLIRDIDDYDGNNKNTTTITNMLTTMAKPIMRTMTILQNMMVMTVTLGKYRDNMKR